MENNVFSIFMRFQNANENMFHGFGNFILFIVTLYKLYIVEILLKEFVQTLIIISHCQSWNGRTCNWLWGHPHNVPVWEFCKLRTEFYVSEIRLRT